MIGTRPGYGQAIFATNALAPCRGPASEAAASKTPTAVRARMGPPHQGMENARGEDQGVSMAGSAIDYHAVFRNLPGVLALLTPDGVIIDVNDGFLEAAGRDLEQVIGRNLFDAFPDNPSDPGDRGSAGPARLRDSGRRAVRTPDRPAARHWAPRAARPEPA